LRETGDAGLDPMAGGVALDARHEGGVERDRMGARADERHLAAQHVDQLRQLVEACAAQPAPDRRDPPVIDARLHERRGGIVAHGAELQQLEGVLVEPLTLWRNSAGPG
jgi:hypothetical protein